MPLISIISQNAGCTLAVVTPLTVFEPRQNLDLQFEERDGLTYLDANIDVFRSQLEDGSVRYDAVSTHEPLNGNQFTNFLDVVAPAGSGIRTYGIFSAVGGIIGDWDILDDEEQNPYSAHLVAMHRHLGGPWEEFARSQKVFIGLLRDIHNPSRFGEYYAKLSTAEQAKRYELAPAVVELAAELPTEVSKICAELEIDLDVKDLVLRATAQHMCRGKGKRNRIVPNNQNRAELWRRFESWPKERRLKVARGLLRNVPEVRHANLFASDKAFDAIFDATDIDGTTFVYPRRDMEEGLTLTRAYQDRQERQLGKYGVEVMIIPNPRTGKVKEVRAPKGLVRRAPYETIVPHIAWQRDTDGSRKLIIERSSIDAETPMSYDGVAGLLLAAYYSPSVRKGWPEHMSIGNDGRRQQMQAAQVPVLALMKQRELMAGPFVQAIETFADAA